MTVAAGYEPAVYSGDGVAVVFPFTWPLLAADHLVVERTASGVTTTLVRGIDYLLTWVAPGLAGSVRAIYMDGGTPVDDPPALGETITLRRVMPVEQETNLRNQGPYLAETVERALDRQTMVAQQLAATTEDHSTRIEDLENSLPAGSPVSVAMQPVVAAEILDEARAEMDVPSNDEAIVYAMIFG